MDDSVTRSQVLAFRARAQLLDREGAGRADTAVLDIGVQDTGPDGGSWALANRGVDVSTLSGDELVLVWSIHGAPHLYRRSSLPSVAPAVEPFSDADAGKRIFDFTTAAKTPQRYDVVPAYPRLLGEQSGSCARRHHRPLAATQVGQAPPGPDRALDQGLRAAAPRDHRAGRAARGIPGCLWPGSTSMTERRSSATLSNDTVQRRCPATTFKQQAPGPRCGRSGS